MEELQSTLKSLKIPSVRGWNDLKDGFVFSRILTHKLGRQLRGIVSPPMSVQNTLHNWAVILEEFPNSEVSPELILKQPSVIGNLLAVLFDPSGFVSEKDKRKVLSWVRSLKIPVSEFFAECSSGVMLAQIINRLEGRSSPVIAADTAPKNYTRALVNVEKVLDFLKRLPKMEHRFLWSAHEILAGNQAVIWGLLYDIKALYSPKVVRTRTSYTPNVKTPQLIHKKSSENIHLSRANNLYSILARQIKTKKQTVSKDLDTALFKIREAIEQINNNQFVIPGWIHKDLETLISNQSSFSTLIEFLNKRFPEKSQTDLIIEWLVSLFNWEKVPDFSEIIRRIQLGELLSALVFKLFSREVSKNKSCLIIIRECLDIIESENIIVPFETEILNGNEQEIIKLLLNLKRIPRSPKKLSKNRASFSFSHIRKYSIKGKMTIKNPNQDVYVDWIDKLGLKPPQSLLTGSNILHEFKSGVLLCDIIHRSHSVKFPHLARSPQDQPSAARNVRAALNALAKIKSFPSSLLNCEGSVLKGERTPILLILNALIYEWENKIN